MVAHLGGLVDQPSPLCLDCFQQLVDVLSWAVGDYITELVMAKKRKKKTPRKKLIDKLDAMWSLITRRVGYCQLCGKPGYERADGERVAGLQAHHLIYRVNFIFRWDVNNGICLCPGCHEYGTDFNGQVIAAHIDPGVWLEKVMKVMPDSHYKEWYDENKYTKLYRTMPIEDMEDIFKELQDQLIL